ncbi:MAG: S41 family peptidase [Pirellulaceae bacterium]|nr:S41 family peptidase [Pirellulaceae bacterium]
MPISVSASRLRLAYLRPFAAILLSAAFQPITWIQAAEPQTAQAGSISAASSVQDPLAQGLDLEHQRNWIDAIHYYESVLRQTPDNAQVRRRLQISRLHHDVVRRCSDSAIDQLISTVSPAAALDLYSEVLARLEMSYVDSVQLTELIRGGTAYFEVALTEPAFIDAQVHAGRRERVEPFRLQIHRLTLARPVHARSDARQLVAQAAEVAHTELGIKPTATILQFALGAIGLLDPYSAFLSPAELNEVESQIEGNFVGLGIALEPHVAPLRILNVIQGGPAREAGLQPDDRILEIGSIRCIDVGAERAADLLRGPEGSQVRLLVQQRNGQLVDKIIARRRVEVPSVEDVGLLDTERKVAYLKISSFQKTTAQELDEALWKLHHQGMQSLVIDLRGNPGGWLDAAVAVADRFLNEGAIVSTRGKNGIENQNYAAHRSGTWQVPLVMLIDDQSASASEILAGAIRDNQRGALVGCTTYGKGSVQGLFHTKSLNCGIRLTVSKFYSPSGQAISELGVSPTIAVDGESRDYVTAKPVTGRANPQTDKALRIALQEAHASSYVGLVSTRAR